ncbi:DUF3365 domain-containing protein [Neiella sp. HB171785]|uniref:DUF3365 domain-containing protein n=2 Tax=Neiella litorisoli TaxID=2771431 RepID=A0A8J6QVG1_9GAMM|nr:DUF3365 domain-containing protein [Neiella litorisoli]
MVNAGVVITAHAEPPKQTTLRAEAQQLVQQFGQRLKPQLIKSMQQGGPVEAIEVCASKAPAIAYQLSQSSGWQLKRVSLKARNQQTAQPDEWETEVLEAFNQQAATAAPVTPLIADQLQPTRYRFMQAQPVEPLCLHCHGKNLTPDIKASLKQHYPNDVATGYQLGQIRGAFSLTKTFD